METPRIHGNTIAENFHSQALIQMPLFPIQSDFFDQMGKPLKRKRPSALASVIASKCQHAGKSTHAQIIRPCIDRELGQEADHLNAGERLSLADTFRDWSDDLKQSVSRGELADGFEIIKSTGELYFHTVGERELDCICANWGPEKRRTTAKYLTRWVKLLQSSADLMDGKSALVAVN